MIACLKQSGTQPELVELFTMETMNGPGELKTFFRREVGTTHLGDNIFEFVQLG